MAWCQLGAGLKNKGDIDLGSLSGTNPPYGSEETNIVVTVRTLGGYWLSSAFFNN